VGVAFDLVALVKRDWERTARTRKDLVEVQLDVAVVQFLEKEWAERLELVHICSMGVQQQAVGCMGTFLVELGVESEAQQMTLVAVVERTCLLLKKTVCFRIALPRSPVEKIFSGALWVVVQLEVWIAGVDSSGKSLLVEEQHSIGWGKENLWHSFQR